MLTGWGGQLSLGQMAFAGSARWRARSPRRHAQHRLAAPLVNGASPSRSHDLVWHRRRDRPRSCDDAVDVAGGVVAFAGRGAVRRSPIGTCTVAVRAAMSSVAVACVAARRHRRAARQGPAARDQHAGVRDRRRELHLPPADLHRPTARTTVELHARQARSDRPHPPATATTTTSCSACSWSCCRSSGTCAAPASAASIIGVRENEPAAAALTVSPTRAKLTAFALGGFIAGLGGALLGGLVVTIGYTRALLPRRRLAHARLDGGDRRARQPRGRGHRRAVGRSACPRSGPNNDTVPLFTSSIGLLDRPAVHPRRLHADRLLRCAARSSRWLEKRLPERAGEDGRPRRPRRSRASRHRAPLTLNADGSVLATAGLTVRFGGIVAVDAVDFRAEPGEVIGLIGTNGAGKSTLLNAIGGYVPSRRHGRAARATT